MRAKRAAKDKKAALAQGEERVDIEKKLQSVGIEPTLLRTRALSVRLNRSAKSAIVQKMASHNVHVVARKTDMTSWRNGNASDSRPEDWGFDSL